MTPAFDVLIISLLAVAALGVAYVIHRFVLGGSELRKLSGKMLVTCPETHKPAAVKVATGRAAMAAITGKEHIELSRCSRWPEREGCDQACLQELKADPENHAVWTIVSKWYQGKNCFYCGRPISELSHLDHSPGILSFDGRIAEWDRLRPEDLPEQLAAAQPVCWNCTVVEAFRKEHPELVLERPWKH
ncbi:MAG TPA: hypothetical protein VFB28_13155 [Terriglobales bacterium]|jgi:hypothetical protein|nr:hypothetical protein [Terriglobales bacterium]